MGKNKNRNSLLKGKADLSNPCDEDSLVVFNFKDLDLSQGQKLRDWHEADLLVTMLEKFQHFSDKKVGSCFNDKFKTYPHFPPKTEFKFPTTVKNPDAQWWSMHLGNLPCVVGHRVRNVFYVVFLDKLHDFWQMKK